MRRAAKILAVVALLVVALWLLLGPGPLAWTAARKAKYESIRLLQAASNAAEREEAVGRYGVVLTTAGGDWIAIRYRDSHSWPSAFSSAVARCSDGSWFQSSEHYCGQFSAYRSMRAKRAELMGEEYSDEIRADYAEDFERNAQSEPGRIEAAASLAEAKSELRKLGLSEFRPSK